MPYILKKQAPALIIRAGHQAIQHIQHHGFNASDIDIIPGAAGGPKGIGIQGLDQAIFGDFLTSYPKRRTLIGSSIGSWRFASIAAWGAKKGTERLAELYTHISFHKKMSMQEISDVCYDMLSELIQDKHQDIVEHTDYHLAIISAKAQHIFKSDRRLPLLASVIGIVGSNIIARKHNRLFMQRVISQPNHSRQFALSQDEFTTHYQQLNQANVEAWLRASASIPCVMSAVRDIPNAPKGSYRDGGLIDYHIDLPFNSQGLVLYPHFTDSITPGWFDKTLRRRSSYEHQAKTVLLSPSAEYLSTLPLGRLPDRKDFELKGLDQQQRIKMWNQCVAESQRLGDEFLEMVEKQNFAQHIQPLFKDIDS